MLTVEQRKLLPAGMRSDIGVPSPQVILNTMLNTTVVIRKMKAKLVTICFCIPFISTYLYNRQGNDPNNLKYKGFEKIIRDLTDFPIDWKDTLMDSQEYYVDTVARIKQVVDREDGNINPFFCAHFSSILAFYLTDYFFTNPTKPRTLITTRSKANFDRLARAITVSFPRYIRKLYPNKFQKHVTTNPEYEYGLTMAEIQEYVNDWYKGRAVYKRMAAIFADINHAICYVCEPKTPLLTEKGLPSPDGLYDSFVITDFNSNHPWDMVSKPQMELMAEYFVLFLQGFPTGKSDEPKLIKGQVQTLQEVMTADKFGMSQRVLDLWVARTYFIHIQGEGCNWDLLYRHCQTFGS
jgi:hypothetical protein